MTRYIKYFFSYSTHPRGKNDLPLGLKKSHVMHHISSEISNLIYQKPGKKPSLHRLILDAFVEGDQLSTLSAVSKFRTLELRKIVSDIRKAGIPIQDRWEVAVGSRKRYKIYYLKSA